MFTQRILDHGRMFTKSDLMAFAGIDGEGFIAEVPQSGTYHTVVVVDFERAERKVTVMWHSISQDDHFDDEWGTVELSDKSTAQIIEWCLRLSPDPIKAPA